MASKITFINILLFILFIITYYLLQLSEKKNCNCITEDKKIYHKILKFITGFLIVSSIVFQNIVNFPIYIKEIFGVINILLIPLSFIIFMIYQFKNECSCFVDNHLLNKILFVSESFSLASLLVTVTIAMCLLFGMLLLLLHIFSIPNNTFYDISWSIIKCEFIVGVAFSSLISIIVISTSKLKRPPRSKWDPVIRKRRHYTWDETLKKYVDDPEATLSK